MLFVAFGSSLAQPPAYELPNSEVHRLSSQAVGVEYRLYVGLPRDYEVSKASYPLLLSLDADYSFALAHNIVEHFVDRADLTPMILVSVAYPGASQERDTYRRHRTRDYTPTHTLEGGYGPEVQRHSGGGPAFLRFLAEELLPFLDRSYRLDGRRTLIGHSYGGLFGAYVLFTRPELFARYLLVSPSLWYDDRVIFAMERHYAAHHDKLAARLFLAVGSRERNDRVDMVADLERFESALRAHRYGGLEVQRLVFDGETHNSVFPAALTRGLLALHSDE
jgi:predicted alpha/beta superfamily hydrolase